MEHIHEYKKSRKFELFPSPDSVRNGKGNKVMSNLGLFVNFLHS